MRQAGRTLPPYYLVYFLLVDFLGFRDVGQSEKVAWSVPVMDGEAFLIEHRKFGLGVFAPEAPDTEAKAKEIVRLIKKAVKVAHPYFIWRAKQAAASSKLNVHNRSRVLFTQFEYFFNRSRQRAEEAKRRKEEKVVKDYASGAQSITFPFFALRQEARWLALAAIEAFFSWTEHIFIHIAILRGVALSGEDVGVLASKQCSDKFKRARKRNVRLIDPDLLRTFVAFVEAGSLVRAANVIGRSASAVTAQMQRLEEIVGEPLLVAAGRGRALTPAGQDFIVHARRILEANREAWLSLKGARADGRVVLGATQDFTERVLPGLLRLFTRTHPRVRLELRVGRSYELAKALDEGAADVVIAMRQDAQPNEAGIFREPMLWLGADDGLAAALQELPLALLDPPCGFRAAAVAALDVAQRPYRIAATSSSLSGVIAAVSAGIAVTLRTARWVAQGISDVSSELALPTVPEAVFSIRLRYDAGAAATDLADLLCDTLDATASGTFASVASVKPA
jgi:DNA-binding transcriptional LysR family regulator